MANPIPGPTRRCGVRKTGLDLCDRVVLDEAGEEMLTTKEGWGSSVMSVCVWI